MKRHIKMLIYMLYDIIVVLLSYAVAMLLLNYDIGLVINEGLVFFIIGIVAIVLFNFLCGLYSGLWAYAGFLEAIRAGCSGIFMLFYNLLIDTFFIESIAIEWTIIASFFSLVFIIVGRFLPRIKNTIKRYMNKKLRALGRKRVLLVGAGGTGAALIREMRSSNFSNMQPIVALDDDQNKIKRYVSGVKVVGKTSEIEYYANKYAIEQIVIAMPSVDKKILRQLILDSQKTGCEVKTVSGALLFSNGQVSISDIKEVSIDDLLGREQIRINLDEILGYIESKTVLVTGGGGSIGSELCRQIATHNPKELIIVDIYENNAYDIEQELLRNIPNLNLKTLIASVRDKKKMQSIFEKYQPEIVFHAAAHKHVPLMETSPNEAVKNNVGGTLNVAQMAGEHGAQKFILISTDKAVNPTNIMGATKRICEMIIQVMDKKYKTEYVAVRFGNVLGSNGSVIPLFKKQIKDGGPVTVTHKDIVRYFMTIPEAVSLVLQAGAYAKGGEIFVLDMGEPVKIYDLAENLIRLSGLTPNVDIDIKITGLRPGEKLYEERLMAEEGLLKTENKMISIGKPLEIDENNLFNNLDILIKKAEEETSEMKELVNKLVPTYKIDIRR